jgi:hypothetical protein
MRPEGTDNNLAAVNLVLIWFSRCWAAPLPTGNRTAQHLASVRLPPGLTEAITERDFAAFLGPREYSVPDAARFARDQGG